MEIVTNKNRKWALLYENHVGSPNVDTMTAQNTGSHIEVNKTAEKISSRYNWPNIIGDVKQFCKTCHTCQIPKQMAKKNSTAMHPIAVLIKGMSQIGINLMHMGKTNRGYNFVITAVDEFSKYCKLGALKNKEAITIGKWIYDKIFCR